MNFFIKTLFPSRRNNYHPHLFRIKGLVGVLTLVVLFNSIFVKAFPNTFLKVSASDVNAYTLVQLTNQERQSRGLNALNIDSQLVNAATQKANYMIQTNCWDHFCPGGSPWTFIKGSGYYYTVAGENLAKSFTTSEGIHEAWMNSTSHRDNIINPGYMDVGIAVVNGTLQGEYTTLVVQMFGARESSIQTTPSEATTTSSTINTSGPQTNTQVQNQVQNTSTPQSSIEISLPIMDSLLNNNKPTVSGTAKYIEKLYLFVDGEYVNEIEVISEQFNLTFEDIISEGLHKIELKGENNPESTALSEVSFTIDSIKPEILSETLSFTSIGESGATFTIKILDNPSTVNYEYNGSLQALTYNDESQLWYGIISDFKTEDLGFLKISAIDTANNADDIAVDSNELNSLVEILNESISEDIQKPNISSILSSRLKMMNGKQFVNLAIVLFFIIIFVVDWLVLVQTGFTHKRIKPFLNLPLFIGILFVGLIGTFGTI